MFRFDAEVWLYAGHGGWHVRRAEDFAAGDRVDVTLALRDA